MRNPAASSEMPPESTRAADHDRSSSGLSRPGMLFGNELYRVHAKVPANALGPSRSLHLCSAPPVPLPLNL